MDEDINLSDTGSERNNSIGYESSSNLSTTTTLSDDEERAATNDVYVGYAEDMEGRNDDNDDNDDNDYDAEDDGAMLYVGLLQECIVPLGRELCSLVLQVSEMVHSNIAFVKAALRQYMDSLFQMMHPTAGALDEAANILKVYDYAIKSFIISSKVFEYRVWETINLVVQDRYAVYMYICSSCDITRYDKSLLTDVKWRRICKVLANCYLHGSTDYPLSFLDVCFDEHPNPHVVSLTTRYLMF